MERVSGVQGPTRVPAADAGADGRFSTFIYAESASSGVRYLIVVRGERLDFGEGRALIRNGEALSSKPNIEVYRYGGDEGRPFGREQLGDFRAVEPGLVPASGLRMLTYHRYTNLTMPEVGGRSVSPPAGALTAATAVYPPPETFVPSAPRDPSRDVPEESQGVAVTTVRPGPLAETRYEHREPKAPPSGPALMRHSRRPEMFLPVLRLSDPPAQEDQVERAGGVILDVGGRTYWVKEGGRAEFDAAFRKGQGFAAFVSSLMGKTMLDASGHKLTADEKGQFVRDVREWASLGPLRSVRIIDPDRSPPSSWQQYAALMRIWQGDGDIAGGEEPHLVSALLMVR